MRLGLLILILVATTFGSGFWYRHIDIQCNVPLRYSIGIVDERFATTEAEIERIARKAEAVWEAPLSVELFQYDKDAPLRVQLIFDERQENAIIEAELREDLDAKEGMSEAVAQQYEVLIGEFRRLKKQYEADARAYEGALQSYNTTVSTWNETGGAPVAVIEELRIEEVRLTSELTRLTKRAEHINGIVRELNTIGAHGNTLITDYNSIVEEYNSHVEEGHEFAQGDYSHGVINIYQFDSEDELMMVMAHEFGHAISLEHVENPASVMYYLMGGQSTDAGLTDEDRGEYARVCEEKPLFLRLLNVLYGS